VFYGSAWSSFCDPLTALSQPRLLVVKGVDEGDPMIGTHIDDAIVICADSRPIVVTPPMLAYSRTACMPGCQQR